VWKDEICTNFGLRQLTDDLLTCVKPVEIEMSDVETSLMKSCSFTRTVDNKQFV